LVDAVVENPENIKKTFGHWVGRGCVDLVSQLVHDLAVFFVFFGSGWEGVGHGHIIPTKQREKQDFFSYFIYFFFNKTLDRVTLKPSNSVLTDFYSAAGRWHKNVKP